MKLFTVFKRSLLKMGIDDHFHEKNHHLSKLKNSFVISIFCLASVLLFQTIIVKNDLNVALIFFFPLTSCLLNMTTYLYFLSQKSNLFTSIQELEEIIDKRMIEAITIIMTYDKFVQYFAF